MAVRFSLDPADFAIPSVDDCRAEWSGIKNPLICDAIAREVQYLAFHKYLIESLRYESKGMEQRAVSPQPINWTVRSGSLKAAQLLVGSIVEAALRFHAEQRGFDLPPNPRHRTFGKVLGAWEDPAGTPHRDLAGIWPYLQELHDIRNNVHLFVAAYNPNADYRQQLTEEREFWRKAEAVLECVRGLA